MTKGMPCLVSIFSNKRIPEIIEMVAELPPSARLLPQIQRCLSNVNTSTAEVIDLLRLDPALTAKTIASANRAFFGGTSPCSTLDEAVNRIGFDELYRLVATIAAKGIFQTQMPVYGAAEGDFLRDSLAVAVLLPLLNRSAKVQVRGDELFTIGLLHAVGKMGLQVYATSKGLTHQIKTVSVDAIVKAEKAAFKVTHPEVSAALLEKWLFADTVVDVVRVYAEPEKASGNVMEAAHLLKLSANLKPYLYDYSLDSETARPIALAMDAPIDDKRVPAAIERAREIFQLLLSS